MTGQYSAAGTAQSPWNGTYESFAEFDIEPSSVRKRLDAFRHSIPAVWPRRLLHVPSMTSLERKDGNMYGTSREPAFSALSYTWGRWVIDEGKRLKVKGISWEIPAVDPRRWTVGQLQTVIQAMSRDTAFVWIDVVCVDQELQLTTIDEIQREPGIFKQSKNAYVWLVDFDDAVLHRCLNAIAAASCNLAFDSPNAEDERKTASALYLLEEPLRTILAGPWFRSNWALREILLCKDVIILGRDGHPVPLDSRESSPATLETLTLPCSNILAWLKRTRHQLDAGKLRSVEIVSKGMLRKTYAAFAEQCLDLVHACGPFFLYSSIPTELRSATEALLKGGKELMSGTGSKDRPTTYSGHYTPMLLDCGCSCTRSGDGKICIPCVLGVSIKLGDTTVAPGSTYYV